MIGTLLLAPIVGYLLWERVQAPEQRDVPEAAALALPVGSGVTAFAALAFEAAGGGLRGPGLPALLLVAVAALLATRTPGRRLPPAPSASPAAWAWAALAAGHAGLAVLTVLDEGRISDWDAWAIWNMKARAFFLDGGVAGYLARGVELEFSWPTRPPLTSLAQAFLFTGLGAASETAVRLFHVAMYASLLLLLFALLRRACASAAAAAAGAALVAGVPNAAYHASSGVANLALGVYVLALLVALQRGLDRGAVSALFGAGACAGFAALARDEGRFLALIAVAAGVAVALHQGRGARRVAAGAALCGGVAWLVQLPWSAAVARYGSPGVLAQWSLGDALTRLPAHLRDVPDFLRLVAGELALPLDQTRSSPLEEALGVALFWPTVGVAGVVLALGARREPLVCAAAITSAGVVAFYAVGLWLFPYRDLADLQHNWAYVLDRHLMAGLPAAAYAAASVLAPRPRAEAASAATAASAPAAVIQAPLETERGA